MDFKEINVILKEVVDKMPFKDITEEKDVILLILENTMLWAVVARIGSENEEGIREVIVKLLSIPPLEMRFHLKDNQLDGRESFIIENNNAFIKAVDFTRACLSEEMKEIYKKDTEEDKDKIKVSGSTSIN